MIWVDDLVAKLECHISLVAVGGSGPANVWKSIRIIAYRCALTQRGIREKHQQFGNICHPPSRPGPGDRPAGRTPITPKLATSLDFWPFGPLNLLNRARIGSILVVAVLALATGARTTSGQPQQDQNRLAPYVATPPDVVERMLSLARVGPGDVVYDLGCGDGRIVIAAAKRF